jgi:hypothetical protein
MALPGLDFFRRVFGGELESISPALIKTSATPAAVYRLALRYRNGRRGDASVVVKCVEADWPADPSGPDREIDFYSRYLPGVGLRLPRIFFAGLDPDTENRILILEDLYPHYRFPPPAYRWSAEDARCFLRSYAQLHACGRLHLPAYENRVGMLTYLRSPGEAEEILMMAGELVCKGIWESLPRLERLVERTHGWLAASAGSFPVTLLHHDLYPPNLGLPVDLGEEAVLIDWEMGGWGLAEFDLAYLFTQPFLSASRLDPEETLRYYWAQRALLEGRIPPADERRALQHFADTLFALALIPVAYQAAVRPYPEGSAPWAYWNAMFTVLQRRLVELGEEL